MSDDSLVVGHRVAGKREPDYGPATIFFSISAAISGSP
jgi:hypothetical protein